MIDYFEIIGLSLGVVFVAALFVTVYRILKAGGIDIREFLKHEAENEPYADAFYAGYRKGLEEKSRKPQLCETDKCTNEAGENGALIETKVGGVPIRRIVCAECLPIYIKGDWKLVFQWGEEFE